MKQQGQVHFVLVGAAYDAVASDYSEPVSAFVEAQNTPCKVSTLRAKVIWVG